MEKARDETPQDVEYDARVDHHFHDGVVNLLLDPRHALQITRAENFSTRKEEPYVTPIITILCPGTLQVREA
jgi:hypothetical protein